MQAPCRVRGKILVDTCAYLAYYLRMKRLNVKIPHQLAVAVEERSKATELTLSDIVRRALEREVKQPYLPVQKQRKGAKP
jgi:hypothetical protein